MRLYRRLVTLCLVVLAIAGCTRSTPGHSGEGATDEELRATVTDLPEQWDPSIIAGLAVTTSHDDAPGTDSIEVTNPSELAAAINPWVAEQKEAFSALITQAEADTTSSLAMRLRVCGAAETTVCVAGGSTAAVGSLSFETTKTWFIDSQTRTIVEGRDLLTDDGVAQVSAAIAKTASEETRATVRVAGRDFLDGMFFDTDGHIIVPVSDAELMMETGGAVTTPAAVTVFRLSGGAIDDLLTADARNIRGAMMSIEPPPAFPEGASSTETSEPLPEPSPSTSPAPAPKPTAAPAPASVDCTQVRCVALTFDDGPGEYTGRLLDILANKNVRATFFVIGSHVNEHPDVVARAAAEGHVVGNHSWTHPVLTKTEPTQVANELSSTSDAIAATGAPRPILMRPPYGATDANVTAQIGNQGMSAILWSVDTEDWKNRDVDQTTLRAVDAAHPGAIVLMHDIHPSTVDAVPGIIDKLRAEGYTLVTVPELMGGDMTPYLGKQVYSQTNTR